jgi:hypothetical protein
MRQHPPLSLRTLLCQFLPAQPSRAVTPGPAAMRQLDRHASLPLTQPLGLTVRCISGSVWLTHDGDSRDIVLRAGQSHTCDRAARLLVHALEPAAVAYAADAALA